jgi:enoyl-CoA hydratase
MKVELREGVALLEMNAGKANAINPDWLARMNGLLDEVERSQARALVITGHEGFFSAGLDLPSLAPLAKGEIVRLIGQFDAFMLRLFEMARPVIAALNGHAIAGGCVLALQADERIMAAGTAKIGLNEVALGIGLPAEALEAVRFHVPARSLVSVALEGRLFSPEEALGVGLVHEVVPPAELLSRALARAQKLGANGAAGFANVKSCLRAPSVAAVRAAWANGDAQKWTDTWFSPGGQAAIKEAVARLNKPRK